MINKSINEIKDILSNADYETFNKIKEELATDSRKGVEKLLLSYEKNRQKELEIKEAYKHHLRYELDLKSQGYRYIAGVDEVGRGPLAGPVYACAVILDLNHDLYGVRDSKKLSHEKRVELHSEIKEKCISYSVGIASEEEIDRYNILNATKLAMKRAITGLKIKPDVLLIDAVTLDDIDTPQKSIIKGDDESISIGAASIIAKVERDNYMDELHSKYPMYNFKSNKGYGTKEHIDAIKEFGPTSIHRRSFIKSII